MHASVTVLLFLLCLSVAVTGYNIGILATGSSLPLTYTLQVYNATFGSSVLFDVSLASPTASYLSRFDAVLVFADSGYANETTLGIALKAYADNGGKVVTALFEGEGTLDNPGGYVIEGNFYPTYGCNYYNVSVDQAKSSSSNASGMFWPLHPILKGIPRFTDVDGTQWRTTIPPEFSYYPGTYTPFLWSDGAPLVVVKDKAGPKETSVAYLGFWPTCREDVGDQSYFWNGNSTVGNYFRDLVLNTLQYVIDDKPYLQPRRLDLCSGTTVNMTEIFSSNATYYGWDSTLYTLSGQTPDASTVFQAGSYNVTYTIHAQGSIYPINGRTTLYVTDCNASNSAAGTLESFFSLLVKSLF